ncbi:MAG: hypothetical protein M1834_004987 [Cirrosporium novae-zelandiae]|nr:MAG: hypothetical protein M1834_004987 [Cirrosporium novae-zelandiae]
MIENSWVPDEKLPTSEQDIGKVISSLESRNTSNKADQITCLSTLLDLDPMRFMNITDDAQRMREFLVSLPLIPPAIIFMGSPRLEYQGFRWAPSSFLCRPVPSYRLSQLIVLSRHPYPNRPAGSITSKGLKIMFPGIRLLSGMTALPPSGELIIEEHPSPQHIWYAKFNNETEEMSWNNVKGEANDSRQLAMIIGSFGPNYREPINAVLVILNCDVEGGSRVLRLQVDLPVHLD